MNRIEIRQARLSFEETYSVLIKGDKDFDPQLSSVVDLTRYAQKLSKYAFFVLLEIDQRMMGCIAYYLNEEGRFIYISHFWVSCKWQRQHLGDQMLKELTSLYDSSFWEIRLEVRKNSPAFLFYKKKGFSVIEDHGKSFLLALPLRQNAL